MHYKFKKAQDSLESQINNSFVGLVFQLKKRNPVKSGDSKTDIATPFGLRYIPATK